MSVQFHDLPESKLRPLKALCQASGRAIGKGEKAKRPSGGDTDDTAHVAAISRPKGEKAKRPSGSDTDDTARVAATLRPTRRELTDARLNHLTRALVALERRLDDRDKECAVLSEWVSWNGARLDTHLAKCHASAPEPAPVPVLSETAGGAHPTCPRQPTVTGDVPSFGKEMETLDHRYDPTRHFRKWLPPPCQETATVPASNAAADNDNDDDDDVDYRSDEYDNGDGSLRIQDELGTEKIKAVVARLHAEPDRKRRNALFYREVPVASWLNVGWRCRRRDWVEAALATDPDLAYLDTAYKRQEENFHSLNRFLGTESF